ncbi:MAG: 50S ribosomal protein L10 [Candidatus Aquicultor secundus]|uniref:Large ribosomal subunit protein uL10 n=2 Tax=Candidatus Aquicultor secundus TaxID=1973895 RepID=A0A2M7TB61_9ACTN|nr:50S ribosomal protein L10 [Candidatus Aquicultor secundus]NCO65797.1 50S ribosomal protein L10 [Solirubrobacter sp.]OIO88843.1 MAG: 50S ribosomal protein L10 [Candidatus Aquicultor secundus]PIU25996.1 MAG: 50S ribosomal protein L10 [Candidatus Aquicultor secundus]PIW22369.1 MAG: 50S ribosomal protein L10 [Candidatus Aquicultor secundus]PIX52126.1 MAG: 50S ribosomal protein L10 [Candidatus Aquicultor secundus]
MARPEKEATVEEIKEKMGKAKSVILTDYRGLNFEQISDLRNKLRAQGVEYKVFKNTLAKLATKELDLTELDPYLVGPTAMVISYEDATAPAKTLVDFARVTKLLELKGGFVEGAVIGGDSVRSLATIPPKEILIAMFMGGLKSPLYGLARSLNQITAGLARVLNQVAQQKGA